MPSLYFVKIIKFLCTLVQILGMFGTVFIVLKYYNFWHIFNRVELTFDWIFV